MYRQGDVLLVPVKRLPVKAEPTTQASDKLILAYGEATGHHHSLPSTDASFIEFNEEVYVRLHTKTYLSHQEHRAIYLPAGDYKIVRQREYVPGAVRQHRYVRD
jgi:hypothetical protein